MERGGLCSSLSEDAWFMTRLMLKTVSRALTMSTLARQTSSCLLSRSRYCAAPPLTEAGYRSVGGTSLTLAQRVAMSALAYLRCTRLVEGGCLARETPGRHSLCGRIGRFSKPPPQLGQTSCKCTLTQAAQNVHS